MEMAFIYQQGPSTMQAGRAKSSEWVLEFEPQKTRYIEPLMKWVGAQDTTSQIHLRFKDKNEAVTFAIKNKIQYTLLPTHQFRQPIKSYSQNFAFQKIG
jgi:ETC complex I subunit-like protein